MIKRLIFDLDNTIIIWKDKYLSAIKETIEEYNLDVDYKKVNDLVEKYENYYDYYSKENMLNLINEKFNLSLKMDFMDNWFLRLGKMADLEDGVKETLEYLYKKYELVILTNWTSDTQIARLKTIDLYKFFKEIYSGENYIKPSKDSFINAVGNNKIEECIMIGDNIKIDVEGAINVGMKAILVDKDNKYKESSQYQKVKTINELKEML